MGVIITLVRLLYLPTLPYLKVYLEVYLELELEASRVLLFTESRIRPEWEYLLQ